MRKTTRLLIIGCVLLAILSCRPTEDMPTVTPKPTTPPPTEEPSPDETPDVTPQPDDLQIRQNLLRSTVLIVALEENQNGQLQPVWSGSGTIVSPDGYILTNAHVATDADPSYRPDALGIAITVQSDEPPEPVYLAEVRAVDFQLDLAVIQITQDLDGQPVDAEDLNLSYVDLGNSDMLELGDLLQILGYPGIGGETITFTEGVVSGFTLEQGVDGRAWVKTDATIAGGNSGGLAASQTGKLVAVPTRLGYGGDDRYVDCRPIADTNGDGVINNEDNCIPVGGFINALRPVNLAKPLIEAARSGTGSVEPTPGPGPGPSGEARFYDLVFSPGVTNDDQPTQVVTQLPSGSTGVYVFWSYEGMSMDTTWSAEWSLDGQPLSDVSWPPGPWQGEQSGTWWIGVVDEQGLREGTYTVKLYVEGQLELEGSIPVGGGGAPGVPTFTNLRFSDDPNDDQPADPYSLPAGTSRVYAFFDYANMSDGMTWERVWYYEGSEVSRGSTAWSEGASGTTSASVGVEGGTLDPGTYRLVMYVDGVQLAAANFTVAGAPTAGGLYIRGYIIDANTKQGIPGAAFIVLQPGVTIETWDFTEEQVYTAAETNANGYFELPLALERGETYSMIAVAEGYEPAGGDGITIADEPSPYEMRIELQQQ